MISNPSLQYYYIPKIHSISFLFLNGGIETDPSTEKHIKAKLRRLRREIDNLPPSPSPEVRRRSPSRSSSGPGKVSTKRRKGSRDESLEHRNLGPNPSEKRRKHSGEPPFRSVPFRADENIRCVFCRERVLDRTSHLLLHHEHQCFHCQQCYGKLFSDLEAAVEHGRSFHGYLDPLQKVPA